MTIEKYFKWIAVGIGSLVSIVAVCLLLLALRGVWHEILL